jgi:hypothetical protein
VVDVVDQWTGRHAMALRRALRLTLDGFADRLGTAVRTIAKWSADPSLVPSTELQRALDTLLFQSPEDVKARFAMLLTTDTAAGASAPDQLPPPSAVELRLAADQSIRAALEWLDKAAEWTPGTARTRVAARLAASDRRALQDRAYRRGQVRRSAIADALARYYATPSPGPVPYRARTTDGLVNTSILTQPTWLDLALPLGTDRDDLRFVHRPVFAPVLDPIAADAPLYRLIDVSVGVATLSGAVAIADFVGYALTMDLLEGELVDALATGQPTMPGHLPLRDRYLPDLASVLRLEDRLCAGGPVALTAIARPSGRHRAHPDFLLLVQERSGRVLNAARRLAVIPKAFHEPLVDYRDDACISATIEREMEEELFGRTDVDSALTEFRRADPMHPSRLSEPMRWLLDHTDGGHWRMECTGFGFNLVSGNYEFASLIVIEDEEWWGRYGGRIEANWESDTLRRYSTKDRDLLTALAHDPAWSNEGLFALLQGYRRLAEIGGDRVDLPTVEWEF